LNTTAQIFFSYFPENGKFNYIFDYLKFNEDFQFTKGKFLNIKKYG